MSKSRVSERWRGTAARGCLTSKDAERESVLKGVFNRGMTHELSEREPEEAVHDRRGHRVAYEPEGRIEARRPSKAVGGDALTSGRFAKGHAPAPAQEPMPLRLAVREARALLTREPSRFEGAPDTAIDMHSPIERLRADVKPAAGGSAESETMG